MKEAVEKKASIKKNFVYNFISQILTLIIPLITTPYLARILHETGNGQISYSASIISYFALFANLGFAIYGQREIAKNQDDKEKKSIVFWELMIIRLMFTAVSLGTLFTILFTIGFGENYNLLIALMSIQIVAVVFDIQFLYYGEENFRSVALRTIFLKIVGLLCVFVFVKTENDTWIYALCLSVSAIISNLIMWPFAFRYIKRIKLRRLKLWRHLKPALIIFIPTLVTSIFTTFDKTMIGFLSVNPDYNNGCYEQAYKINSIAQILVTLFSSVMMSRNTYDYNHGNIEKMNKHVYDTCNYVWLVSLPLIAGFIVLSSNFSAWFLGDGYAEVPLLLCIMSVRLFASGFSVVLGDRFIVMGKEKFWTIAVSAGAAVNVGLNFILIPSLGAVGAAITTAVTEVMILIAMAAMTFIKKDLSFGKIVLMAWKYIIAAIVMFFGTAVMQHFMHYSVWEFLLIGSVGIILYALVLLLLRDKFFIGLTKKTGRFIIKKFRKENKDGDNEKKMSNKMAKIRQYRSGRVLCYALRLTISRKLRYLRDKKENGKVAEMHTQLICNRIIYKLRKRYKKIIEKYKNEIDANYESLPHERSNKIWILWFQKMECAPEIVRLCYQSILDNLGETHEIILLNEENYYEYAKLPEHIIARYEKKQISKQLLSDMIRLELLAKYGGTWIDATVFCANKNIPWYVFDSDLFMYQTLWPATWGIATVSNTWFINSCQNNNIVLLAKSLMYDYFKKNKYSCDYWLVYDFLEIAIEQYPKDWAKVIPVCHTTSHILQDRLMKPFDPTIWDETIKAVSFHKLNWRYTENDMKKEGTFYRYLIENYKIYEATDNESEI